MDLTEALTKIKKNLKKAQETNHFKEKCEERGLDIQKIKNIITNQKILGIIEQNKNLYKIWYEYTESKDLNIVINIMTNNRIKLVTLFPCLIERRKR